MLQSIKEFFRSFLYQGEDQKEPTPLWKDISEVVSRTLEGEECSHTPTTPLRGRATALTPLSYRHLPCEHLSPSLQQTLSYTLQDTPYPLHTIPVVQDTRETLLTDKEAWQGTHNKAVMQGLSIDPWGRKTFFLTIYVRITPESSHLPYEKRIILAQRPYPLDNQLYELSAHDEEFRFFSTAKIGSQRDIITSKEGKWDTDEENISHLRSLLKGESISLPYGTVSLFSLDPASRT